MTVYFNSNALNNEYTKRAVNKVQTSMDRIQTQINTGKQHEHFYDLSFTEATNLLYNTNAIEEGHQEVSILREGLYKTNEMSQQLQQLQHILRDGLSSWQTKYNREGNIVTTEEMKKFANNMLGNFETILNKRSGYDGTYLFSGEDVDIKPIDINEKNYYRGSKHNILFTYNEQEVELDFNAGDKSISDMVAFLKDMKNGENYGEVFDKLSAGVKQIIESKREVDLKSHDIKRYLDREETLLAQNIDKYNGKIETNNISALTDLTRISGNLHAIYVSNKMLLSTKLVDFL